MTPSDLIREARELAENTTPGPWKYDYGNWEVEGPRPDRYPICAMSPDDRAHHSMVKVSTQLIRGADGEFIARSRTLIPELTAALDHALQRLEKAGVVCASAEIFLDDFLSKEKCVPGTLQRALRAWRASLPDDYELAREPVLITHVQFWQAVKATAVDMRDSHQRIAELARLLGL